MSDQGQGQFRGVTWETKSDTPSPTPFPGTTSPSPVQRNADALGAATPTTHATPTALSPPSNVGETREGAAGESNTSTSQSGTNHNDGTMSQDIALDNAPYCAVKSTVARALDAEHKDQHPHSACDKTKEHLSEGLVVLSEYALDFSKEFVTNVGELTAEHMVEHAVKHAVSKEIVEHVVKDGVVGHVMEHKKAIAGGAVALAAAAPDLSRGRAGSRYATGRTPELCRGGGIPRSAAPMAATSAWSTSHLVASSKPHAGLEVGASFPRGRHAEN